DAFLYLDPPYYLPQRLYGEGDDHIGFDHEGLAELLRKRERWILSYNDCPYIRDLYKEYHISKPKWIYGMCNGDKKSREILVLSRDISRRKNRAIKVGTIDIKTIDIEKIYGR
ncbi:MAG: DNA adenine methylase, partial [Gemmatimonadetes bacterium]|nr:DNA adenine methylase [Gemmatimonadota bacterium]